MKSYILLGVLCSLTAQLYAQFGMQNVINESAADRASSVFAADLDGDGDIDMLSASFNDDKIAWYENNGNGVFSTEKIISISADGAKSVFAVDLDGDNDIDVLSASFYDNKIAWYENLGNGMFSAEKIITTSVDGARSVYAADLDGDGDMDVLSASSSSFNDKIAWYENLNDGLFSEVKIISNDALGATSVYSADIDGDGDYDVLSSSSLDDKIAWYKNLGNGTFSTQIIITTIADAATSVFAADLDGDNDLDVLSTSFIDGKVAWYENMSNDQFGDQQVLYSPAHEAQSVIAADLDGDGDMDVLSASIGDNRIAWYENQNNNGFGEQQIVTTLAIGATSVYVADIDGDGDLDVMSSSKYDDNIAWYKNIINDLDDDGVLNDEDCAPENPNISAVGDSCDDGDVNTENDLFQLDCICEGTPILQGVIDVSLSVNTIGNIAAMVEGCNDGMVEFCIADQEPLNNDLILTYSVQGSATYGVDYDPINGIAFNAIQTIIIPAGQICSHININTINDGLNEDDEFIEILLFDQIVDELVVDSAKAYILDALPLEILGESLACAGDTVHLNIADADEVNTYEWGPSSVLFQSMYSPPDPTYYQPYVVLNETTTINLTSTVASCVATDSITIEIADPNINVEFMPIDDITVSCEETIPNPIPPEFVSDPMDDNLTIRFQEDTISNGCDFQIIRTWTASNICGDLATISQIVLRVDSISPIATYVPINKIVTCLNEVPTDAPSFSDCDPDLVITYSEEQILGNGCPTILRSWIATDICGNSTTVTQNITINDTEAPTLNGVPESISVDCLNIPDIPTVTAIDNCDSDIIVSFYEEEEHQNNYHTITRTWSAIDACGNLNVQQQVLTILDTESPVFTNLPPSFVIIDCNANPNPDLLMATDNCDDDVVVTFLDVNYSGGCLGGLERTWTATDNSGNTSLFVQFLTKQDTMKPVFIDFPTDTTIYCDDEIPNVPEISVTDNCDSNVEITFSMSQSGTECPYTITRTWTAEDECGNIRLRSQVINVLQQEIQLSVNVFLDGPIDGTSNPVLMKDNLRMLPSFPLMEPYSSFGNNVPISNFGVTTTTDILNLSGENAIVDWILIELRDDNNTVLDIQAALLQRDGDVVSALDGISSLIFENPTTTTSIYVVVRHRNHLAVREQYPIIIPDNGIVTMNFSDGTLAILGEEENSIVMPMIAGKKVMRSGDANSDGQISVVDKISYWRIENASDFDYSVGKADFNLDGVINSVDMTKHWRKNNSKAEILSE